MAYVEFKAGEKHASTIADQSPFHEQFMDAGWVLEETDLIVDIDNLPKETIVKMIETFGIKTQITWTDRGCHLWFTKPKAFKGSRSVCPLGFEVEYKHTKNTKAITIKREGKLRQIDNMGVRSELPDFLYTRNKLESLEGLDEGDGRNAKLYAHKFKVMSVNNHKRVLSFINNYIFAQPLEQGEFDTIARDEEIRAEKDNEYDVAIQLIRLLKIVKYGDVLYLYDGSRYKADSEFETIIAHHLKGQKIRYQDEVIEQIKRNLNNIQEPINGFDIKFKNGILRNGKFISIDSTEFTPFYIDIEYNEDAKPVQVVDEFLHHLSHGHDGQEPEEAYKDFLLEIVAHCLITDIDLKQNRNFQRVFFFAGNGGNGKGAMFRLIRALLGKGNYKTNKLEKFADERYIYGMKGMLGNLGDDIEDETIKSKVMSNLKSISAYEEIELRQLFGMPISESITATQIFTTNHVLKSFEKGESWKRRVVWCPMYVTPKAYDPTFYKKLLTEEALEYFLKHVLEAYFRLLEKGDFTYSEKVDSFTNQYHDDNNSCITFVNDHKADDFIGQRPPSVYEDYKVWAEEQGRNVQTKKQFKTTMEEIHGLIVKAKKINGKTTDVYMEK
jgi:putative DNA primase/helicase